ncbi:MAG: DUF2165 family protein [Pseudomonadota bacterium]
MIPLDLAITLAQTVALFFLAAWLTTGAWENVTRPSLNGVFTAEVLAMTRMERDYPEMFEMVAHRRITNPTVQRLLFRLIVAWEIVATIALWVGVIAMAAALIGFVPADIGRAYAVIGALAFTSTWAGFLVAGNWFCYWFSHDGAQVTHFHMTLWGLATLILLVVG